MTTAPPLYYILWWRPGRGTRWKKVGRAGTYAEALTMMRGKGDWWPAPVHDPALVGITAAATDRPASDAPGGLNGGATTGRTPLGAKGQATLFDEPPSVEGAS